MVDICGTVATVPTARADVLERTAQADFEHPANARTPTFAIAAATRFMASPEACVSDPRRTRWSSYGDCCDVRVDRGWLAVGVQPMTLGVFGPSAQLDGEPNGA